jgi:TfoX/Sxy family transcriptional regulator of competence genes
LSKRTDVVEKKMFGGLCFMVNGAMCCGLSKADFVVRVGPANYDDALAEAHARPMDFTGRPLAGMVYVEPEGLRSAAALTKWVERGLKNGKGSSGAPVRSSDDEWRVAALMHTFRSDPKLVAVIEEIDADTKAKRSAKLGLHGLTVNGRLFARFTRGTLVVKLPKERVVALVAARIGEHCDPGRGRLMKWLKVTSPKASWIDLAKESLDFVQKSSRNNLGR